MQRGRPIGPPLGETSVFHRQIQIAREAGDGGADHCLAFLRAAGVAEASGAFDVAAGIVWKSLPHRRPAGQSHFWLAAMMRLPSIGDGHFRILRMLEKSGLQQGIRLRPSAGLRQGEGTAEKAGQMAGE